jgi:hypothetical protein
VYSVLNNHSFSRGVMLAGLATLRQVAATQLVPIEMD